MGGIRPCLYLENMRNMFLASLKMYEEQTQLDPAKNNTQGPGPSQFIGLTGQRIPREHEHEESNLAGVKTEKSRQH